MAWGTLTSNQMVSFTDAQGGGFALNGGQSHTTSTQCMTKNDALTKYSLNASLMSSYSSTQLVPKSAWASGAPTFVSLGYEGRNTLGAQYDGQTFAYCRDNTNTFADNFVYCQAHTSIPANFDYIIARGYMGFNGASVPTITSGGVKINLASAADNTLQDPTSFVLVRSRITRAYNYVWNSADYTLGMSTVDGSGNTPLYSQIVTINPGQLGDILIPFSVDGISYVNSATDINFILMEYDHDWLNVAPTVQYSANKWIRSASSLTKLYYY